MSGYATTRPLADRIAIHTYGTNLVSWYAFVRALLPPAATALDAGAGVGGVWAAAGPRPDRLVLTDLSNAMCERLRAVPDATVVRGAVNRLPYADASFDGALCCHVLYHLADPRAGLAELRRVVRPGGWLAVATNGAGHMAEVSDLAVAAGLPRADVHEHFPAARAAEAVGEFFEHVETHVYDDTLEVPDADPVVAYVASMAEQTLTPSKEATVRAGVTRTPFRVGKNTVLVLAR